MSELNFRADAETLRILEKYGLEKKDDFINRAVQAYATAGGAFEYAAGKGTASGGLSSFTATSPSSQSCSTRRSGFSVEWGVREAFGSRLWSYSVRWLPEIRSWLSFTSPAEKSASLELSECQSILKSLRPPISLAEVVEMLT